MSFLLFVLLAHRAPAEAADAVDQVARHAIVVDRGDSWTVVPLGKDGLFLYGRDDDTGGYQFARYDVDFKPVWSSDWAPDDKQTASDAWVDGGAVWFLMHRRREREFDLLRLDIATGGHTLQHVDPGTRARNFDDLLVHGQDGYFAAIDGTWDWQRGTEGTLEHVDVTTGQTTPMDVAGAVDSDRSLLHHLVSGPDGLSVTVAVDQKHHRTLYVLPLSGTRVGTPLVVAPADGEDKNLLSATRVPAGEESLVIGTFANGERSFGSQGMYLAAYANGQKEWLKYHSFTEFKHFFDYLSDGARERIQRKIERKDAKGEDLSLNYLLDMHAPMVLGDRYVMVGEAFYPEYHTYSVPVTTTINGVTTTTYTTYVVFDGWRYTHAVVAAFNKSGDLLWDSSVPIGNVLSPTIREHVAVSVHGDRIDMLYCVGGKVYSLEADGNEVKGERAEQRLEADEDETIKTAWSSHSAWWYDDWFLLWGYEKVKTDAGKRMEFTFTKVEAGAGDGAP